MTNNSLSHKFSRVDREQSYVFEMWQQCFTRFKTRDRNMARPNFKRISQNGRWMYIGVWDKGTCIVRLFQGTAGVRIKVWIGKKKNTEKGSFLWTRLVPGQSSVQPTSMSPRGVFSVVYSYVFPLCCFVRLQTSYSFPSPRPSRGCLFCVPCEMPAERTLLYC